MRLSFPADPARRAFAVAVVCSILLHVLLLGSLVWVNTLGAPLYAKRGEPLIVDIAPDKPEEKAPLGNPARPPAPEPPPRTAEPRAPTPKVMPPLPKAPAPSKAYPPRPEPPQQVAKVAPPAPEPPAPPPTPPLPAPESQAPAPQSQPSAEQATPRETPVPQPQPAETAKPQETPTGSTPPAGSEASGTQTALAKPPPEQPASIFRHPGGGGGLRGGRGGTAGEPIPLDTPDPNYREYMDKVKQRIYAKWGYPYEAQTRGLQGKLVIEFHIARDGHLQFIELRQTSGEDILDSFAVTAVKLAQTYPPLPDAMKRDVLPIVAVFVYTLRGPLSVLQSLQ